MSIIDDDDKAMTKDEYRAALERLGMAQGEAAAALGISLRTSAGYATGSRISPRTAKLLRLMVQALPKKRQPAKG